MNKYKELSSLVEVLELTTEEVFEVSIIEGEDISNSTYNILCACEGMKVRNVMRKLKETLDEYFNQEATKERQERLDEYMGKPVEKQPEPRKRSNYYTVRFLDNNNVEGYAILENKDKLIKFLDTLVKVNSELIDMFYTDLERSVFTKVKLIEHEGQLMIVGVLR